MPAFDASSQAPTALERVRSNPAARRAVTVRLVIAAAFGVVVAALLPAVALGQSSYYRHTFFDNGPRDASYYYSAGKAVPPSALETWGNRLPLDASTFFTAPNSLKVAWESKAGGAWAADVSVLVFRNRDYHFDGDTLEFWVYSPEGIRAAAMPNLRLLDMSQMRCRCIWELWTTVRHKSPLRKSRPDISWDWPLPYCIRTLRRAWPGRSAEPQERKRAKAVVKRLLLLLALATMPLYGQENQLQADFRSEGDRFQKGCLSFDLKALGSCAQVLFTDHPLHIAVGSIAPQNGFAAGAAFVAHWTPDETCVYWKPSSSSTFFEFAFSG